MRRFGVQVMAMAMAAGLAAPVGWAQEGLKIRVIAGEGGINNIENRVVVEPIIEIQDAAGKPIPKAAVTFRSPSTGPSVTFFGAAHASTLTTDDSGRARAAGMAPNTEEGSFFIDVEAKYGDQTASLQITQTNAYAPEAVVKKKKNIGWKVITLIGVAAAGGIAAAALSGDGGSASSPTTVGVGGVSVGAPR